MRHRAGRQAQPSHRAPLDVAPFLTTTRGQVTPATVQYTQDNTAGQILGWISWSCAQSQLVVLAEKLGKDIVRDRLDETMKDQRRRSPL
jgi:hypothetical protein